MERKEDRRVQKTKRNLEIALMELMLEKPIKNITVLEISERADINRGTFYLHYKNVSDMAEKIQKRVFGQFSEIIDNYTVDSDSPSLLPLLEKILVLLKENAELARCLIGENGDTSFIYMLKQSLKKKFMGMQEKIGAASREEFDYFYDYAVSGCAGICKAWLEGGLRESPSKIAEITEKFIMGGGRALKKS